MPGIDSYTKLMLHCDGSNGSTTFTDSSASGKTVTANSVTVTTGQYKFATGAADMTTDLSYLSTADHADWNVSSGNFTFDCFLYFTNFTNSKIVYSQIQNGGSYSGTQIFVSATTGNPKLYTVSNGLRITSSTNFSLTTWQHFAIVTSSGTTTMYIAGQSVGSWAGQCEYYSAALTFGNDPFNQGHGAMYMDEARWSKGIARWTANFTPPTVPYSLDSVPTVTQAIIM
jgi:hypothetical protein